MIPLLAAHLLLIHPSALASQAPQVPLKKIQIVRSDARRLDDGYRSMNLPKSLEDPEVKRLREYVDGRTDIGKRQDPEIIFKTLAWVSRQWKHDGNNDAGSLTSYEILQNAAKGTRYRCVEYGKVSADILQTYGYVSRQLAIQTPDVAYGGYGMGHVVSEIWSNKLDKWIFTDPQFGLYAMHGGRYLSFYDLYELKSRRKFDEIRFLYAEDPGTTEQEKARAIIDYKRFLSRYFGQLLVPYVTNGATGMLALMMEKKTRNATFQGHPAGGLAFAENASEVYHRPNHASMVVWFQPSARPKVEGANEWDDATFRRRMGETAARPDLRLAFQHNMPWFSHFEVKVGGKPFERVQDPLRYLLTLPEGRTTVTVVAVNQAGVRGVPCVTEFSYGS